MSRFPAIGCQALAYPLAVRASRLVNLLLLLQTRGQQTAEELARELEVSLRTVYRDIDALGEAGIPIYGERGPHGGIRLVEGYRTRLTGLTSQEAEALFLAALPGPAADLGLASVAAAARLKVLAALPNELSSRATRISERFHLDAPQWFQQGDEVPHLQTLARAVWEDRVLEMVYDRGDQKVERRVEPLGLVLKAGTWYLVARSGDQHRTYRVSRVVEATVTLEAFERPADFELADFWAESIAAYERDLPRVEIRLKVAEDRLDQVQEVIGRKATKRALESAVREDGTLVLPLTYEWLDEAAGPILRMAAFAEVLEPAELRGLVLETAQGILRQHGGHGDSTLQDGPGVALQPAAEAPGEG
jgi:predicted DNA-binding transcriptional regulator YafY